MNKETLEKANALNKKIRECDEALNCFESEWRDHNNENPKLYDRTPRLIIDADDLDNGREQIALPFNLSNALIEFMKEEIKESKEQAIKEFESL